MKILILGATGGTGKHLVQQALAQGHLVTALVRDPSKVTPHANLQVVRGDVTAPGDLEPVVRGRDAVLCALGPGVKSDPISALAARALVGVMMKEDVKRVIWISAGGVGDSAGPMIAASFVFGRIIMPLFLRKPYANHFLAEETFRSSALDWTVVRPVQLIDTATGNAAAAAAPGSPPKGLKIARQDLATYILAELKAGAQICKMPIVYA